MGAGKRNTVPFVATTDSLLSVPEVMAVLRVSEGTVRTLIRKGDLPGVRPSPGRVLVRRSDLERYIATLEPTHG